MSVHWCLTFSTDNLTIQNAHNKRDLKEAVDQGKVSEKIKQLSWANMKFSRQSSADIE